MKITTRSEMVDKIAAALLKARPMDLYTNTVARETWYRSVGEVAEALFPRTGAPAKFFDKCGVPD